MNNSNSLSNLSSYKGTGTKGFTNCTDGTGCILLSPRIPQNMPAPSRDRNDPETFRFTLDHSNIYLRPAVVRRQSEVIYESLRLRVGDRCRDSYEPSERDPSGKQRHSGFFTAHRCCANICMTRKSRFVFTFHSFFIVFFFKLSSNIYYLCFGFDIIRETESHQDGT